MKKIPVVVVCGPTASGKTGLGIELAGAIGGEIISADSMQVYRRLDIGTAKPDKAEMSGIPHHMLDVAEPWESYSVARYCDEAKAVIEDVVSRGKLPIIVGGTGLYIDNLIANTDFSSPEGDEKLRAELRALADERGVDYVHGILRELDPSEAEKIHPNNLKRVIRAVELIKLTGESRKSLNEKSRRPSPFSAVRFAVDYPRDILYERINHRVDIMLERGLIEEVRRELLPVRNRASTAVQAIGYKEILEYLDGKLTLSMAVEAIKQNSRRYAKRQLTWFRRNNEINWLSPVNAREEAMNIINQQKDLGGDKL